MAPWVLQKYTEELFYPFWKIFLRIHYKKVNWQINMRKAHIMSVFKKGDGKILETTGLLH